ncbi:hypothetical protein SUDANB180_07529 [Streptomyces sp. enrichment culture]
MHLFFTDRRNALRVGSIAGLGRVDLEELFERRRVPDGTPILLDEAMRPVEPVSSWFRALAMQRLDPKSMKAYAYTALMLLNFLLARQTDLRCATE